MKTITGAGTVTLYDGTTTTLHNNRSWRPIGQRRASHRIRSSRSGDLLHRKHCLLTARTTMRNCYTLEDCKLLKPLQSIVSTGIQTGYQFMLKFGCGGLKET